MTSEQKVENVEAQVKAAMRGATNVLTCPYCRLQNKPNEPICCMMMARAVAAIMERVDIAEQVEEIDRIRENIDREPSRLIQ